MAPNSRVDRPIGIIDIGSNSIHLTLARPRSGRFEMLARLKDPARLAGALDANLRLRPANLEKAIATLKRFAELAAVQRAELRAVATAAIRAARNRDEFIRRAKEDAGVTVELLKGTDEARLTYLGVQQGLSLEGERIMCVDVGGGSTELACGLGPDVSYCASVAVGSLTTSRHLLGPDPIRYKTVKQARRILTARLAPALDGVKMVGFDRPVATAGTIQRVKRIARALNGTPMRSLDVHGLTMTREELDAVVERLARCQTHTQRLRIPGLDAERADTLLGGALIFQVLGRTLDIDEWTVSMAALRSGLLYDTWRRRFLEDKH